MEKLYTIYYGENDGEYIRRYLKDEDILDGYLSEKAAFDLFYDAMIMSNDYLKNNYNNLDMIISNYDEEDDSYSDEYQVFIIDPSFDEEITEKATKKMGNTLYYDNDNDIYLTGITDLGTSRTIVPTWIKVEEVV